MIGLLLHAALACEALVGVTVHAPDGPHPGWDVAWQDERILRVGPGAGAGCAVIDARGAAVTPGFIAVGTYVGVQEVGLETGTHRHHGPGGEVRAAFRVMEGYNPRSVVVPVTRLGGITSTVVFPEGGFVAGQAGAASLAGETQADAVIAPSVAVVSGLHGGVGAALTRLRAMLADARALAGVGDRALYVAQPLSAAREDLAVMLRVARGELPLVLGADLASDIEAVVRFARAEKIRVVVSGGAEAWAVAPLLAEAKIPVIVDPFVTGSGSFDQVRGRADNAALLADAGVDVIIGPFDTPNARSLRFRAGNAVRGGLDHPQALAALTATPARVFGLTDRGELRPGAVADLVLWTGDPLDVTGRVAAIVIGGAITPLKSRQTELAERWRDLGPVWAE